MARANALQRLHTVNRVLAAAMGADEESAVHARHAIDLFADQSGGRIDGESFNAGVDMLARVHAAGRANPAFSHVDGAQAAGRGELFLRERVIAQMKRMAGASAGVLLVTNLRESVCPEGGYWTKARAASYARLRDWVESLAAAWASRGQNLQVVVL